MRCVPRSGSTSRPAGRWTAAGGRARTAARPGRAARADHHSDAAASREWARAHGHQVSDRGPIPAILREAYRAAK